MTTDESRITIHMASSLDFFVAKKESKKENDESYSWLEVSDTYEKAVEEEDPGESLETIDCWVMGSRTYETTLRLGWPYGDIPAVVLTHRDLPSDRDSVSFYSGDLNALVNEQLKPSYKNIWVVGGTEVASDFIRSNLADDLRITFAPILLGEGLPFFEGIGSSERELHLKNVVGNKSGFVELWYEIRR